ncbi:MAG TPA: hypothetical protein VG325_01730 [Solirubrobacteraceae bacterium]|nr:hypothetical protein [Solirubrobacteraceae bacterium]
MPEVTHTPTPRRRALIRRAIGVVAAAAVAALITACGGGGSAPALPPLHDPTGPESMFTSAAEITNPATAGATIATLKSLGVDRVHVPLYWATLAPDAASPHKPSFDATDPAAYPASAWAAYDSVVRQLKASGMGIDMTLSPPPPRWAEGPGAPHPAVQIDWAWRPSAAEFGQFVRAVATRYSGHYVPPGASKPLPRVDFWSIWNEPDLGIHMAPEAIDHSTVEVAPRYYRAFVDAAWSAFGATGHGHDTVLIGELAPAGVRYGNGPGNFNSMPPLQFLRALYCVDKNYQPLRGQAATARGCPATAAGSARFAADHPGLFHASGVADHPYPQGLAPNQVTPGEPDYAELAATGNLEKILDRLQRIYGSTTKLPIWSTEFGYQTTPPDTEAGTVSPQTAAYYINWAEYLTWLDPRQRSYDQYLLTDPSNNSFATGLLTAAGAPKPGLDAYRMPLFLPVTTTQKGHPLDVWGCVRPAPDAAKATHRPQSVEIQFSTGGSAPFRTVEHVPITNRHGYFEVRHTFPGSGDVRLTWSYPHGPEIHSRTVVITLR